MPSARRAMAPAHPAAEPGVSFPPSSEPVDDGGAAHAPMMGPGRAAEGRRRCVAAVSDGNFRAAAHGHVVRPDLGASA